MTLNNHRLMLLTKFALKAKNHIGAVKVADMFYNELHAFDALTKAILIGDKELIELSKNIIYEFELGINLINAIEAYIYKTENFQGDDEYLEESKYVLSKLAIHLYDIKIDGASYRHAVDKTLLEVDVTERTFTINLARKFYRAWKYFQYTVPDVYHDESLKMIVRKNAFIKLWNNIDHEFFSNSENPPLTYYSESMFDKGISEKDIIISLKIAKVITIELRNEETSLSDTYRDAIERVEKLFEKDELKKLFLIVSREFHQFWLGNIHKKLMIM